MELFLRSTYNNKTSRLVTTRPGFTPKVRHVHKALGYRGWQWHVQEGATSKTMVLQVNSENTPIHRGRSAACEYIKWAVCWAEYTLGSKEHFWGQCFMPCTGFHILRVYALVKLRLGLHENDAVRASVSGSYEQLQSNFD